MHQAPDFTGQLQDSKIASDTFLNSIGWPRWPMTTYQIQGGITWETQAYYWSESWVGPLHVG